MSHNPEAWTPLEVADWIAGLSTSSGSIIMDDSPDGKVIATGSDFSNYSTNFLQKNVSGKLLLNLMAGDFYKYGIHKVGDQLLMQEAIQSLRTELLDTPRITLQSLASSLAVRCRNYRAELSLLSFGKNHSNINYIPTDSLASASFLLDSSKTLIRWLTRFPFLGNPEYDSISVNLTKHCFELAVSSQRDTFADNAIEEVQYLCTKIIEICEGIIQSRDSLVIQPAAIDVITLRKRTEQDLGLQLESSYFGLHQVSGVKLASPAQQSGNLEKGDEILQVNYQTVVGWPQQSVVNLLNENSNEVSLTIKRRPRHATANILAHMYLRPSNKMIGGSSRSNKRHSRHKMHHPHIIPNSSGLVVNPQVTQADRKHQKLMPISPVPEDENSSSSTTSSSGNTPVVLLDVEVGVTTKSEETKALNIDESTITSIASDSKKPEASSILTSNPANSRFWKLYPRPKNLIRRRATVTGASPTSTRPPVTFIDDEHGDGKLRPPLINSKSAPEKIRVGLRKQANVSSDASGGAQNQTHHHRVTMPAYVDTTKIPTTASTSEKTSATTTDTSCSAPTKPLDETGRRNPAIPDLLHDISKPTGATVIASNTHSNDKEPDVSIVHVAEKFNVEPETQLRGSAKYTTQKATDTNKQLSSENNKEPIPIKPDPRDNLRPSKPGSEPKIVMKSFLHLRQSPANLLIKSNSLTSTSGNSSGFSSHPRWTRHVATLNSHDILQIGSDPAGSLAIDVSEKSKCEISLATEVHSRPFAFKIDTKNRTPSDNKWSTGIYYLAAESQNEFDTWIKLLIKGDSVGSNDALHGAKERLYHRMRSGPMLYKRSISLGNSPSYSRRNSWLASTTATPGGSNCNLNYKPNAGNSENTGVLNRHAPSAASFTYRNTNSSLARSRIVGVSTPNVQHCMSAPPSENRYSVSPVRKRISNSEAIKSEWFNSSVTPTTTPKRTLGSFNRNSPRTAACSTDSPIKQTHLISPLSKKPIGDSGSNISSITIRTTVRKSDSGESGSLISPKPGEVEISRSRCLSGGSKLPSMGVNMMLAKQNQGSPTRTELKVCSPKKSSSSSSSSSEVFLKSDVDIQSRKARRSMVNCPSCGGSTSSYLKEERCVQDVGTQTDTGAQIPVSPNLDLLRQLIKDQVGSRV